MMSIPLYSLWAIRLINKIKFNGRPGSTIWSHPLKISMIFIMSNNYMSKSRKTLLETLIYENKILENAN